MSASPDAERLAPSAIRVRRGTSADAGLLADLGARLFHEAFAADSRPDDLAAHLRATFSPEIQRRELESDDFAYFVAELGGEPVGYALLRRRQPPPCVTGPDPIELGRIYVEQRRHGSGAAVALMEALLAEARARRAGTIWLGVWGINRRAVRFYEKFGFRDVGTHTFWFGSDPQTDQVMVLELA
jgi:ribosomal protein S18 acetylase RimI-like enzyme